MWMIQGCTEWRVVVLWIIHSTASMVVKLGKVDFILTSGGHRLFVVRQYFRPGQITW
jgi:hypothetical protein